MNAPPPDVIGPPASPGPIRWLKKNLFSNGYNSLLTLLTAALLLFVLRGLLQWILVSANWAPVSNSLKLFATGSFPSDQLWRLGVMVLLVSFLFGLSWRVWGGTVRSFALALAVFFAVLGLLPIGSKIGLNLRLWFLANPLLTFAGYQVGRTLAGQSRWVVLGWLGSLLLTLVFLAGLEALSWLWQLPILVALGCFWLGASWRIWAGPFPGFYWFLGFFAGNLLALAGLCYLLGLSLWLWIPVGLVLSSAGYLTGQSLVGRSVLALGGWLFLALLLVLHLTGVHGLSQLEPIGTGLWGGLLLTFLLAVVGIVASFPIGVLLALGRRSSLPVVKACCVLFIEVVRGVPLVTILFMASIILPLFLPEEVRIDRVLRAMIGMTLFAAAYMAENVRGGLQAIPQGQVEAAKAVGLNGFQTTLLIVLPQALRLVIPAIVGQFIALFMDTTLAIIVGLTELLAIGRAVLESNVEWKLLQMEVFLFVAAIFWVFNFAMSYASRRLEVALGVGER